jgi:hypothetical protein
MTRGPVKHKGAARSAEAFLPADADSDRYQARRTTLGYGMVAADPLLPETFAKGDTAGEVKKRLARDIDAVEKEPGSDEKANKQVVLDGARKVGVKDPAS